MGVSVLDTGAQGPVAVLLPDGPCFSDHLAALSQLLAPDLRVICVDLPGNGFCRPRVGYDYSFESGAAVLNLVMDELRIQRAVISASCVNCHYAIRAAEQDPARWAGLVLHQAVTEAQLVEWARRTLPRTIMTPLAGQVFAQIATRRMIRTWFRRALPPGVDPTELTTRSLYDRRHGACFCIASLAQALASEPSRRDGYPELTAPVQLVWGAADPTHIGTNWGLLPQLLPSCSVRILDDVGHFPEIESAAHTATLLRGLSQ